MLHWGARELSFADVKSGGSRFPFFFLFPHNKNNSNERSHMSSLNLRSSSTVTPAPGEWVTSGDVPADFDPVSRDSGVMTDSDCTYREYSWSFSGTAPYGKNIFSATLNTSIELSGQVIGVAVSSDDNATVTLGEFTPVKSYLNRPASECFFKEDGTAYSGSFPLSVTYDTIGGPWFINVRIRVAVPKEDLPPVKECLCKFGGCGMSSSTSNGRVDFSQPFGGTPFASGFPKGALRIYARIPVRELFSGSGLRYLHPMTRKVKSTAGTIDFYHMRIIRKCNSFLH